MRPSFRTRLVTAFTFGSVLFAGQSIWAGTFSSQTFTGDADSGISSALQYSAVIDFNGSGSRNVNGVLFNNTTAVGNYYTLTGGLTTFGGNANSLTGSSNGLASDFFYTGDGSGNASLTLGGLTVGQQYTTTWYNVGFGGPGGRFVNITPSDTGVPFLFDENFSGSGVGNLLRYTFTATAKFITYNFDAVSDGDSFHHYALTNSGAAAPPAITPVTPVVTDAISPTGGSYAPFTVSNNDLLQTSLGSVTSSGNFTQEGNGGIPILNNGTFSITGQGGFNPELATGADNSSVTFNLNTTVNTLGYTISSIAGYGGWNDSGRDKQLYNIFVSFVGDPTYVLFGGINDDVSGAGGTPSASRAVFTPGSPIAGVDAVRIEFIGLQENGYAGYGEFDVIGTATVPEPGTVTLLLCGLAGFCGVRRRRG